MSKPDPRPDTASDPGPALPPIPEGGADRVETDV